MGLIDKIVSMVWNLKEIKILVVGLNDSGKSTVVNQLKGEESKTNEIVPTVGLKVEKFKYRGEPLDAPAVLKKCLIELFSAATALPRLDVLFDIPEPEPETKEYFTAFDMSGHDRERWERYYNCHGIIFVVDSADHRMAVARIELNYMLLHPDIKNRQIPILFLGNKMDLPGALSTVQITASLGLERIVDHPWHICATNALTGEGIEEGMQWFIQKLCNNS